MTSDAPANQNQESEWMDDNGQYDGIIYNPTMRSEAENIPAFLEQLLYAVDATRVRSDAEHHYATIEVDVDSDEGDATIEVDIDNDEGDATETEGPPDIAAGQAHAQAVSPRVGVLHLLASSLYMQRENDDAERGFQRRRGRAKPDPNRFPKVPSEEGTELMNLGTFGVSEMKAPSAIAQKKKLARRILDRELGIDVGPRRKVNQLLMAQGMIPSSNTDMIINYDAPVYSGQFSGDGNFFFSCVKDFKVRMYDTSNPYKWRYYKTVDYPFGRWTLTDATLTPDNKYLAYTSIQSKVCLAPTDPNDVGEPYTFDLSNSSERPGHGRYHYSHGSFGIWSVRFSGDGRELVAGTSANSIVVYDVESRMTVLEIPGHDGDVNAVCFGDASSPHILYSGSDDTTLKVWDRRSMGDSREAGAFVGHTEGLTYIDSKGDGRYILSNGKDQSMKLWDLRRVMTTARFAQIDPRYYTTNFDYTQGSYDEDNYTPHPYDNSLVTFRGHKVLRTLIRCHFSPPGSTNSRYVYSGSEDGKVYVYNMDATLAGKIDVFAATRDTRPSDGAVRFHRFNSGRARSYGSSWKTCIRDASWHPNTPIIAVSAWNGYDAGWGTVTTHSWNDGAEDDEAEPKMGVRVDDRLRDDESYYRRPRHGL